MLEVLLFGGTAEGRALAQWLSDAGAKITLCVATDYGGALVPAGEGLEVRVGRLDQAEMAALIAQRAYTCAVDATHPYAVEVSRNIRAACCGAGLEYRRLIRPEGQCGEANADGWRHAENATKAADLAEQSVGPILLTTGSKELDAFARPNLRERCFPRVLPTLDSLGRCLDLGFPQKQIICMQGPFSEALNLAMIDAYQIQVVVSKVTGVAGGFAAKAAAAQARGCAFVVIDRPAQEEGLTLAQMKRWIKARQ